MLAAIVAAGCGRIAVWAAPEKIASAERTPAAVEADKLGHPARRGVRPDLRDAHRADGRLPRQPQRRGAGRVRALSRGLEQQWRNLDVCVAETVDRANPDDAGYTRLETREGPRRVGRPATAAVMYRNDIRLRGLSPGVNTAPPAGRDRDRRAASHGGGGGHRTHVRKPSATGIYINSRLSRASRLSAPQPAGSPISQLL
jgi:hypothetical protein